MTSPDPTASDAERVLDSWRADPVLMAREAFGVEPWSRQAELLRAVAAFDRVAVRSGHKVGKSITAAILAFWFALTRTPSRVVLVSSSAFQVKDILWREVRNLYDRAKERGFVLGPEPALDPATGLLLATGDIKGVSTNKPERAAGVSGAHLFYILDEASGIDEAILEAIEGNRAGGAKIVMFSNPTRTSGTYFDAFHEKRRFWKQIHISSEESPNVKAGRQVVPGLALLEYVKEKQQEWGEDSPLYAVRVRGDFPAQGERSVVSLASLTEARKRHDEHEDVGDGPLELGVDPAREGDDEFVIAARRGRRLLPLRAFTQLDGPNGAGKVLEVVRELRREGEKPRVKVDVIGIGASVYDSLKHSDEVETVPVSVAKSPTATDPGEPEYALLRDQLWFAVRAWLKTAAIPEDGKLENDLVAPQYSYDARGRIKVEGKAEIKKRLKRSPDRADAVCLAVYAPPPPLEPASFDGMPRDYRLPFTVPNSGF
jgi:hypothetical protein